MFSLETLLFLLIKYLHLVALLVLFSSAIAKYVLVVQGDTNQHKLHLARELGGASLIASIVILVSGVMLLAAAGMNNSVYLANRFFLAKMALFVVASVAVLVAKRFIARHSMERSYGWVKVPDYVRWLMRFDLAALLVMVALALLMTA